MYPPVQPPKEPEYTHVLPVPYNTWKRVVDFTNKHPNVDIKPLINERINDLLDEAERAENG